MSRDDLREEARKSARTHCQKIFAQLTAEDSEEVLCTFIASYVSELCCLVCRASNECKCDISEKEMAVRLYRFADAWAVRDLAGMAGAALARPKRLRRGDLKKDGAQ